MPDNNACLPHFPSIRNYFTLQNKKQQDCALGASFSSSSHIFPIPSDFLSLERGKKLPDHTFIARQFWLSPENAPPEMLPRWQAALLANTGAPRTGVVSHILIIPCVWGRPHINTSLEAQSHSRCEPAEHIWPENMEQSNHSMHTVNG